MLTNIILSIVKALILIALIHLLLLPGGLSLVEEEKERVFHLNSKNSYYLQNVTVNQIFCVDKHYKSLNKIWSTAYVKIQSTKPCIINDGNNLTDIQHTRKDFGSTLYRYISRFKVNSDHERCDSNLFVSLYKNTYIHIETLNGELDVSYIFTAVDIRLIILCVIGIGLYYASERLARNEAFYYASGISIGLLGSILILVIIAAKLIPKKSIAAATFLTGTSAFMFVTKWIYFNFQEATESFKLYILGYLAISAIISATYLYTQGPIQNPRYLRVIEYFMKFLALCFIYMGVSAKEIFFSFVIGFLLVNLAVKCKNLTLVTKLSNKLFPVKRRLLTQDEYSLEADEYTRKQLKELQNYCRSPECNSWRIMTRLKSPERFAKFVEDQENHVSDDEVLYHDIYNISNDLIDEDNDF